jgi:hypothetical protein
VDIPYNDLLIRNLLTRNIGGSNNDLIFNVNVSGDAGSGTERMRFLTNPINNPSTIITGIGNDDSSAELRVREKTSSGSDKFIDFHSSVSALAYNPLNVVGGHSIIFGSSSGGVSNSGLTLTIAPWTSSSHGLVLSSSGRLGVNTNTPAVALDIVGEARSSISTTTASNAKTLVTKDYVDARSSVIKNLAFVNFNGRAISAGLGGNGTNQAALTNTDRWIRASHNVTRVMRLSEGKYRVDFTNPLPTWYCVSGMALELDGPTEDYQVAVNFSTASGMTSTSCFIDLANLDQNNTRDGDLVTLLFTGVE